MEGIKWYQKSALVKILNN